MQLCKYSNTVVSVNVYCVIYKANANTHDTEYVNITLGSYALTLTYIIEYFALVFFKQS